MVSGRMKLLRYVRTLRDVVLCYISLHFSLHFSLYYIMQPELAGLVVRMPLEVELRRNYRHSLLGARLSKLVDSDTAELSTWYARARLLVEQEMQTIANTADEGGQVDTTQLKEESAEMLGLYLDSQETWQEVGLVLEKDATDGSSKTLVLNRPMATKMTENVGKLVLHGAFMTTEIRVGGVGNNPKDQKDFMRFMMAFGPECAVYVGGPDGQDQPAIVIHGIPGLPGATEIAKGTGIYQGGIPAAVQGVLDGKFQPLDFRFFVGCHVYEESALEVAVHLGKYQPIACARAIALKQCVALPKPLWHEGMLFVVVACFLFVLVCMGSSICIVWYWSVRHWSVLYCSRHWKFK
jgi:hypothetical protein